MSFVLDACCALRAQDSPTCATRSSSQRIGVAGHSLGAITTLGVATNSCCVDQRVDAAVAWSGVQLPFPGGTCYAGPTRRCMLVHGDADRTVPSRQPERLRQGAGAQGARDDCSAPPHMPFGPPWVDP